LETPVGNYWRFFVFKNGNKLKMDQASKELWPNLSASQHAELKSFVGITVQLISRENESFKVTC